MPQSRPKPVTPTLTIDNWMVAWTRSDDVTVLSGAVEVGPWPDRTGWSRPYRMKVGACFSDYREGTPLEKIVQMFMDFHTCVVRDRICAQAAHREFLKIDEYQRRISPDTPGLKL